MRVSGWEMSLLASSWGRTVLFKWRFSSSVESAGGAVGNSRERRDKGLFDLGEGFPGETNFGRGNRNCGVNITQKRGAENLEDRGGLGVVNFGDLGQGGDYFGLNENGGGRGNSLGDFVR